ncbi:hypothetical protein F511_10603 [Dorcoceras hygrometricum]|uniref:TF-B3 domain-containing protein n=1 Tax=Dorcoceras hygrometricum TaxID=472368 RepID=A0A2Z7CHU9_9LAMI|nr:hypothetical protein F511_10603 [Dorcoceras hygrometricum]
MSAGKLGAAAKDPPPPIILRFFKILQNEKYSQILYLPPAFARKVKCLVDKETYLENSSGQRWAVKVSKVDGSLAIHGGWNEFFTQQSLMVGQVLEFHYIKGSHFLVRVYGRSGCERISFTKVAAELEPIQKLDAIPNSKLKRRACKRPIESGEKDVPEDEEGPRILRKKKESHVMQKAGSGKSDGAPTIVRRVQSEPMEVLVDVPILFAEKYKSRNVADLASIKTLANLAAGTPNVVSGIKKGEGGKASLPAKNAELRTRSNATTLP